MDRCLLPYVTFLQEHDPAPFAEYILARELIGDETEAEDAYAWAKQFALYDDLAGEQREDGSWGAYLSAETATSKNCRYKTTARALQRARDLALPADDPAVVRARALLHRYLSGETPLPDTMSPRNFTQRAGIRRQALLDLSFYEPEDEQVMRFRSLLAERLEYACASGRFDRALESRRNRRAAAHRGSRRERSADFSVSRLYRGTPAALSAGVFMGRMALLRYCLLWGPVCAVGRGIPFLAAASGAASGLFAVP